MKIITIKHALKSFYEFKIFLTINIFFICNNKKFVLIFLSSKPHKLNKEVSL